ncbi:MAG: sigma-70 family RNA polymerase sigma factor [Polyangiales bacterium]
MAPRRSSPPPPPAAAFRRPGAVFEDLSHLAEPAAPPPVPSDALVLAAKNGNRRAFAGLVLRYRPRILALALHLTGNAHDAEDVTQDVFLRAWQHLPTFEHRSAFFTWIYRIAVNRALQARERRRARPESPSTTRASTSPSPSTPEARPPAPWRLRETYHRLVAAFDTLSPSSAPPSRSPPSRG